MARARRLILGYGWGSTAYQILNPGIERWFSRHHEALVGYVGHSGYRLVAGAPVCALERLTAVTTEFVEVSRAAGYRVCCFAVDRRSGRQLWDHGNWDRILLGAEPYWNPEHWHRIVDGKASLRAQLNRARNKGVEVAQWETARAAEHPDLERCLEEWLATRGLPPLHFLVEPRTLSRLFDRRIFVAIRGGKALGFLVASPMAARRGWLIEQTIRGAAAPNGTTELLLDAAMRALAAEGAAHVTLGLAPLSRRAGFDPPHRLWLRWLLRWVRAHGRRFYSFDGLDAFKAKFVPDGWDPIYAMTPGHRFNPRTLYAIAGAFGDMSPPALVARALGRAAVQELRWLQDGLRNAASRPSR